MNPVRHNPFAIAVAALVYFMLGGVWFTVFRSAWLVGINRTMEELQAIGTSPLILYASAIVTTIILAVFLSWLIQATGPQTLVRGITIAIATWFGVVFTTWSTEYAFEGRTFFSLVLNNGYCLVGMILMGAILGAWKKKA